MAYNDELDPVDPLDQLDAAAAHPSPMPVSQFDAVLSGQPMPNESADAFSQRRKKLADLGALGPRDLPTNAKEASQAREDASQVREQMARRMESQARQQDVANRRAAAQAEAARKKQWQQAGIELSTADDGSTVPATHPDGRVKYKPDMLGDAYKSEDGRIVRDYRDEFGGIKPVDLDANGDVHTDAQTGERYVKNAGGLRVNLGVDEQWQQREQTRARLDSLRNEQTAAEIDIAERKLAAKPVIDEWTKQDRETRDLRNLLEKMRVNATTMPAIREQLAKQEELWATKQPAYDTAKKAYDAATGELTTLEQAQLDRKREALKLASNLDAMKAKARGVEYPPDSLEAKANATLKAVQSELQAAQDEARTAATTASVVNKALSGGATAEGVEKIGASGNVVSEAVNAKIKAATVKAQAVAGMVNELDATNRELETTTAGVNARLEALNVERQKLHGALLTGTLDRAEVEPKLAALEAEAKKATGVLDGLQAKRKSVLEKLTTTFDDPAKWEQSPERGLALAEVERKASEMQQAGGTAVEGAKKALETASTVTGMVEGKPIKEQIATLKAELQRRQKATPRADLAAQIDMLDVAMRENRDAAGRRADFEGFVRDMVAKRNGESERGYFHYGSPGKLLDGWGTLINEQSKAVGEAVLDPKVSTAKAATLYVLGALGSTVGGAWNTLLGRNADDLRRAADAQEARQLIGDLDEAGAKAALETLPTLENQWNKTGSILTPEQAQAAISEGDAGLTPGAEGRVRLFKGGIASLNRTLYGAEKLIKELQANKGTAIADAMLERINDLQIGFSSGQIEIDESNPQQVAQRAFLRTKLAQTLAEKAPGTQLAGNAIGSLMGFVTAGAIGRGTAAKLGKTGKAAGIVGTGAVMGAERSFSETEGNVGALNRGADIFSKGASVMLSELLGDKFGDKLEGIISNSSRLAKYATAAKFTGRAVGGTVGEIVSDVGQNAIEGGKPGEGMMESLIVNPFLGVGMALVQTFAESRAMKRGGGKNVALAVDGAVTRYIEAGKALTAARIENNPAKIIIAQDAATAAESELDDATGVLLRVSSRTQHAIAAPLRAETKALTTVLEENEVLRTAAVAIGAEVRDAYLPGNAAAAAEAAARTEKGFDGPTGAKLAGLVVDQMVGGAVARDLAGVAQGNATLTPAKTAALARIELIAQTSDGRTVVTDDGVAFLPKALRKQIKAEPDKFGVMVTAGNSADIARGLLEQGRRIIAGRTGTVAKQQAAAITQAIAPQPTAAPSTQQQGATATFAVTVKGKTKAGSATQTYPAIVADDAAVAEKEARRRAASVGITVETADVELVSAETNETPETPQQQGTAADSAGQTPAPAAATGEAAQGAVQGEVEKPKKEKNPTKPNTEPSEKTGKLDWSNIDAVTDPFQKYSWLEKIANSNKVGDEVLTGILDRLEVLEGTIGSLAWQTAYGVASNPSASAETKERALALREEWMRPGRESEPKAEKPAKPAKPAKPEPTPEELTRRKFEAAFKKAMAGDRAAKSFGALNVKIVRGAALPADKWIGANKTAAGKFSLLFNSENAAALFPGKTDAEITTLVETAIGEELIHLAQFEVLRKEWDGKGQPGDFNKYVTAFYTKLFATLDTATKEAVRKIYGGNLGDWQLSAEGVRQLVQLRKDGKLTEQFVKQFTDHLRAIVDYLKSMLGKAAAKSDMLAKAVTDTEAMLAEIEGAVVEKVGETLDPKSLFDGTWRVDENGYIRPAAFGAKWDDATRDALIARFNAAGIRTTINKYGNARFGKDPRIKNGFGVDSAGSELLDTIQRELNKEAANNKADAVTAATEARNQKYRSETPKEAGNWIDQTFGVGAMNDANRKALADYLTGATPRFEGQVSNGWRQGFESLFGTEPMTQKEGLARLKTRFAELQTPAPEAPKLTDIQQEIKDAFGDFLAAPSPDMAARDAEYMAAVDRGDMAAAQRMVDAKLARIGAFWHGTPSGDLRGGVTGLHVGTKQAAMEALEARIGIPADGKGWNGDREYGKTLLAGKRRINSGEFGPYRLSGYNTDAPDEDYYPTRMPSVGNGVPVSPNWKPWIRPVLIVGKMTNSRGTPISDTAANRKIVRKSGAYYTNDGEDAGSVSAVLPSGESVRVKLADPVTRDEAGNVIPLSQRFNPASDSMLYAPSPAQSYDEVLPVDRLAQIVGLSQSLVSKGVKTPEALAENLTALGPKAVSISQRLWQLMHGFGAEGPLQPDWRTIYAPSNATPESVNSEQSSEPTGTAEVSNDTAPDAPKEYAYGMHMRPLQIGAQPKGFTRADEADKRGRHGVIYYNRPLTAEEIASFELKDLNAKEDGVVDTIAGRMNLDEFEENGYSPEQVTKEDWINLQRANRRKLGQDENGDSKNAPNAEYEEYHKNAVAVAVRSGEDVDPEVLKDYPDLRSPEVSNDTVESLKAEIAKLDRTADDWRKAYGFGPNSKEFRAVVDAATDARRKLAEMESNAGASSKADPLITKAETLGLTKNILARIARGQTDEQIGNALQLRDGEEMAAAVRASGMEMPANPNIGREWNSPYGRQRIVAVDEFDTGSGPSYDVETVGEGTIRRYSGKNLEEDIKRDEYRLTPEYAAEQEEAAKKKAAYDERIRKKAEETKALEQDIADFGAAMKLSKLEIGKAQKAMMVEVARDVDGKRVEGPRAKVAKALVEAGYVGIQKDKEWRLQRVSDGRLFVVTKTEVMFANWLARDANQQATPEQPVQQPAPEAPSGTAKTRSTPREGTPEREALKAKSKAIDAQIEAITIEIDALRTKREKAKSDGQRDNIQRAIDGAEKRREEIRTASAENRTQLRKAILEDVIEDGEEINAAFALEELTGESNPELFDRAKAIAVEAFKAAGFNDTDAGFYGTDVVSSVASTFAVKDRAFSKYLAFSVDMKTRQRTIAEARAKLEAMPGPDDAPRRQFLVQLASAESRGDVEEANAIVERAMKFRAETKPAADPQPTSLRGDAKQVSGSAAAAEASTKGRNTEPKVMKAQKQFITEALAEAIAEAPEEIDPAQPKHIKIAVPNDGTFFLTNTKAVLRGFLEKVNKGNAFSRKWVSASSGDRLKETDKLAVPFVTSGFPTGPQSDDAPEPAKIPNQSAVPKLGKPKSIDDFVKITESFRGNDATRIPLSATYGDGDSVFATDGRQAIAIKAPNAGKKDALHAFGSPKEKMTVQTLDGLKEMFKRKGAAVAKGIDTDHLWSMLKAAKQAETDRFESVRLWLNPDHTIGVSLWGNPDTVLDSGAYYAGNMQDNATELGMFNVDYLLNIVGAVRAAGSEFLTISKDQDTQYYPPFHFTSENGGVHALLMQMRSDMTAEQEIEEMARRGVAGLTPEQKQEIQARAYELLKVKLANLYPADYVDHFEALNEVRLKIPASMADLQHLTAQASDKLKDMVFSLLSEGTKYGWSQFASRKADDPAKINMLVGVREQLAKASRPVAEPMPRKDATAPKPAAPAAPAVPVEEKKAPDPLRNMSEADRAEAVRLGNAIEKQEAILDREWILDLKVRGAIDDPKWDIVMSAQIRRAKLEKLLWEAGFDSLDNLSADVYAALGIKNLAPHLDTGIHLDALRDISDYAAEGNKEKLDRFKVTNPVESYHWEKYLSKGIALDKDALDLYNDREAATFAQRFYADTAGSAEKTIRAMYDNDAHSAAEAWIDDHLDRTIDQHIESTRWSDDERNLGVGWSDYSAEIPVYRFTDGKYYTFTKLEMVDGEKVIRIKEIAPRQIVIPKDSVDKGLAAKKSADRKAWIAGGNDREIAPGYKPRTTGGLFDVAKKAKDYTAKIAHARRLLEKIDKMLESDDITRDRIDSLEGRAAELEKQITDWQRGLVEAQLDRQRREAVAQASKSMDEARARVRNTGAAPAPAAAPRPTPTPSASRRAPKPPVETGTDDAGEELKANRRGKIGRTTWDDLAGMNETLRIREATKAKLVDKPDYDALIKDGMDAIPAYLVKTVYDSLAAKPRTLTDEGIKLYISGTNRVMEGVLRWAKDKQRVAEWAKAATSSGYGVVTPKGILETVYEGGSWRDYQEELKAIGGNKVLAAMQPFRAEAKKAAEQIAVGWPSKKEAWQQRGYQIVGKDKFIVNKGSTYGGGVSKEIYFPYGGSIYLTGKDYSADTREGAQAIIDAMPPYLLFNKGNRLIGKYETEEAAIEAARNETSPEKMKKKISSKGTSVLYAKRTGPARRMEGENITSEQLIETFGFRGVNFGNWMKGGGNERERQLHLNHAYDGFLDMAEVLNVPAKAMSLNGMLGLAFGAQGSGGKAAAHFVPGFNEINLTRESGAGAVAHEWGHALDHYFGVQAGIVRSGSSYLSDHQGKVGDGIRPEIVARFKFITQTMKKRAATPEEIAKDTADRIAKQEKRIESWLKSFESDFVRAEVSPEKYGAVFSKIRAGNYGSGSVATGKYTAIKPVVDELREVYKEKTGRLYSKDQCEALSNNLSALEYLKQKTEADKNHIAQVDTQYLTDSQEADKEEDRKKPYWSTTIEMFARAFDAFVSDKMESLGVDNTYISGMEPVPPKGDDRKAINAAFESLVGTLLTKETEQGTALYAPVPEDALNKKVGLKLNEVIGRLTEEDGLANLGDVKMTDRELIKNARKTFDSWPDSMLAADGSGVDLKVPDNNYAGGRLGHLTTNTDARRIDPRKIAWLPRVPETLANAQVRLVDDRDGTRLYVRRYTGGIIHAVVVKPYGQVEDQAAFTGNLTTAFPFATGAKNRQSWMVVDWEKGQGLRQNAPEPTSRASLVTGPQRETFLRKGAEENPGAQGENALFAPSPERDPAKSIPKHALDSVLPASMPPELREQIKQWEVVSKSPYSDSFYDITNKSWGEDPDGFLRVADHWNFTTGFDDRVHAVTERPVKDNDTWTLGRKNGDVYEVIGEWPKDWRAQASRDAKVAAERFAKVFTRRSPLQAEVLRKLLLTPRAASELFGRFDGNKRARAQEFINIGVVGETDAKNAMKDMYSVVPRLQEYATQNPKARRILFIRPEHIAMVARAIGVNAAGAPEDAPVQDSRVSPGGAIIKTESPAPTRAEGVRMADRATEATSATIRDNPTQEAYGVNEENMLFAPSPIDLKQVGEEAKATQAELANPTANQSLPSAFLDMVRMGIKGSRDRVNVAAPGAAAAIIDAQVTGAKTKAALREMLGKLKGEIDETLGKTKDAKGVLRRKQFVAELLPVAARLNATGRDAHGNLVFSDFAMRAGTAGKKQVEDAGFTTGDIWRGRDGEKLRIGEYLEDQKAYQLFRDMPAPRQAGLYADFESRYPELVHLLNSWIDPDLGDMRVTDDRGTVLPAFNRHALRKFFGDVSPHGGLDEVAGYVPEISRTRSLAGILTMAVRNLLNRRWKSGAHEYKTGDAREHKQVHDLVTAFGIRAMEAHAEAQRKATAEALLNVAVRPMPPGGIVPEKYVRINPDNLASLVQAYGAAHGMTPEQLRKFTKAVNTMDKRALQLLVGQAWAKIRENHIIHRDALAELVRPLTDRVIRNKAVAVISALMKSYVGGLLVHPFTWLTNMGSNELFKAMRIGQQTLFGGMMMAAGLKRGATEKRKAGKVALREAWELSKLMLYGRFTNKAAMNQIVPKELFENNTSISGAVMSITEDNMTAMDFLKQANVPQAILKAVRYSDMDVRAKQQLAYASIVANAQVAADEAVKKGFKFANKAQRAAWMKKWINSAGPELQRDAYNTAVAYAMDYENVPWWLDDSRRSPEANIIVSGLFPFAKWPYNMLRQMKRFGGDSSLDVLAFLAGKVGELTPGFKGTAAAEQLRAWKSGRMVNGTKLANAVAHLGTYAMMMAVMRALLSTADDEDEVGRLGRSFDQAGDRLEREFDTSNRVKINDVPILGKAVEALARMHGDDGTKQDYWLRVRNIPYAAPMLAMASTMSWLGAKDDKAKGYKDESLNAWREFVGDFVSEGIVLSALNAIHGNESKYVQGQPVSATLGAMAVDLGLSRIAPVPLLSAARDLVDPNMRRLNQNDSLGYDPGFVEGVKSRIPGLADDLPLKGTVRTRTLDNAIEPLAKIPANEKNSVRIHTNDKGKPVASYVDPNDKRDIPRYRTALRFLGLNVKATDREEYKMAVKGQIKSYRKLLKDLED